MDSIIYNVPLHLVKDYPWQQLIVRSSDSAALARFLSQADLDKLSFVQLLSLTADTDSLALGEEGIAVDLVMQDPATEFSLLYRHANLVARHPARVSIAAAPGFSKAVKVAVALDCAVKLEVGQPDHSLVEELLQVLDFYLHHTTTAQPIEYFHSTLLAFYHQEPVTLWTIQGEDPVQDRYITDKGKETISERLTGATEGSALGSWVEKFQQGLLAASGECAGCETRGKEGPE